jgi:glycosyltransferase involved in cell wall biosynthesis
MLIRGIEMESLKFLMTTTFYPPYHVGGDAVHVKYLADELVKRGHEVHVFHSLDAYRLKRKEQRTEEQSEVHLHTLKSPFGKLTPYKVYSYGNSSFVNNEFTNLVREIQPDVVHHHNISLLGFNLFKKRSNYLNLYTAHDYWLICQRNDLLRNGRVICDKRSCASCVIRTGKPLQLWRRFKNLYSAVNEIDLAIAPSDYMRKKIESLNIETVHIANFAPLPKQNIKDAEYNDYFLFVGILEKHKGIDILLEVFADKKINRKLVIVGKGSLENSIDLFIKANNMEKKIVYLRWIHYEKLLSLYKNALAVVIPSVWEENCPMVALESLSMGTPVISSNFGGLPEIVEKLDRNLVFENNDLPDIIKNYDKNRYPAERIKDIYINHYSSESYMDKYLNLIR